MQETPRPAHITSSFPACPPSVPAYPVASTATSGASHSPPPTPGLTAQQLSPSPQMPQTPNRIPLQPPSQPNYSRAIPSTPLPIMTTDASPSHDIGGSDGGSCSLPTPSDVLRIIKELDTEPPSYMYSNPQNSYSQMDGSIQQQASPYIPVTSPSASSDQPCYSPVTPVQSPANRK